MIPEILLWTGFGIVPVAAVAQVFNRISRKTYYGWLCVSNSLVVISDFLDHDKIGATIQVAFLTWVLWLWWNSGGGDDTKRRLRDAAKKFSPTRRTAPVTS